MKKLALVIAVLVLVHGNLFAQGAGKALQFDGSDDYVSVQHHSDWDFGSGEFTIEAWAKFNDTGNSCIASHWHTSANYGWIFYYYGNGNLYLSF